MGHAHFAQKEHKACIEAYRAALAAGAAEPRIHRNMATAHKELGQKAEAAAALEEYLKLSPADAAAHLELAELCLEVGEHAKVIDACKAVLALKLERTQVARAHTLTGHACFAMKKHKECTEAYEAALAAGASEAKINQNLVAAHLELAKGHLGRREYPQAVGACEKLLALDPKNPDARVYRGDAHFAQKEYKECIEAYEAARAAGATEPRIRQNLVVAYLELAKGHLARKEYTQANGVCEKALGLDPRNADALVRKGEAHEGLGEKDKAIAAYEASGTHEGKNSADRLRRLSPEEIFDRAAPAVVFLEVWDRSFRLRGMGSGFLVSEDGLIVTCHHVVRGAAYVAVSLPDDRGRREYFAEGVAASDPDSDLALLKVNGSSLPTLKIGPSGRPKVGADVCAIGSPAGRRNSFSKGTVSRASALEATPDKKVIDCIQFNAPGGLGSSGCPVLDTECRVVGVMHAQLLVIAQNVNFAVPAERVSKLVANRGPRVRPFDSAAGPKPELAQARWMSHVWDLTMKAKELKDYEKPLEMLSGARPREDLKGIVGYWLCLGLVQRGLGKYDLASDAYEKASKLSADDAEVHLGLAICYVRLERFQDAIEPCRKVIELDPNNVNKAEGHAGLGACYRNLKRYQECIDACKLAIGLDAKHNYARLEMGMSYESLGRHDEAIAAYSEHLSHRPKDPAVYLRRGFAHLARDRNNDAKSDFKTAEALDPTGPFGKKAREMLEKLK